MTIFCYSYLHHQHLKGYKLSYYCEPLVLPKCKLPNGKIVEYTECKENDPTFFSYYKRRWGDAVLYDGGILYSYDKEQYNKKRVCKAIST